MRKIAVALVLAVGLVFSAVRADEVEIALDKLPKSVVESVKKHYPKAELKKAVKEVAGDKTSYEVEIKNSNQNITVTATDAGAITGIEKEIALKSVPKIVMDTVMAKYPKGKPTKGEEVYRLVDGKETFESFEVILDDGDKKDIEVYVSKEGKIIK